MKKLSFVVTVECPDDMVPGTISNALVAWLNEGQRVCIKENNVCPSVRATSRALKFKRLALMREEQLEIKF